MRLISAALAVLLSLSGALAPDRAYAQSSVGGSDTAGALYLAEQVTPRASTTPQRAGPSLKDSYTAIPLAERIAIQSDLVWAGLYSGPVNGEFSDPFVNAVRAFQRQNKTRQTGVLNPAERQALSDLVKPLQDQVGWRTVLDANTGVRLGLPMKLAPNASAIKTGSLWSSAQGQVRIETFRIVAGNKSLADIFEQFKTEPSERKIEQQALRPDSFAIVGMQGLKKFHVRGYARNGEIRGITILYDQAVDGTMDPLMPMMATAFQPFATPVKPQEAPITRRKVEYGTGLVVSSVGHIVTDLQVIDDCQHIIIPGIGHAERVAADTDTNLALLRVYGAEDLVPIALLGEAPKGNDLTLIGIADPQTQAGSSAISTTNVKLLQTTSASGSTSSLNQTPVVGFSGAAALDKSGRFYGMVGVKIPVVAGSGIAAAPKATIIPAETIRNFIEANYVSPTSGQPGVEQCKASIVRVICVRK